MDWLKQFLEGLSGNQGQFNEAQSSLMSTQTDMADFMLNLMKMQQELTLGRN